MFVLNGKWRIRIILCLASGEKGFNEIKKCHNISPRILSKELKELEINKVINRYKKEDNFKSVIYELSEQGKELIPIIIKLQEWGERHRKNVLDLTKNI
ncbi:helix-turn-helix domain-containing protein [uncultured Draconibacterium sp.]|uniref:winged helix-turn-helix transcriptional regulator n=1 Tax=uncultured Draconibacterium sp. TaxID=1573823 RepID=UPI0032180993